MRPHQLPFVQILDALYEHRSPTRADVEAALRLAAHSGYLAGAHDVLLRKLDVDPFGVPESVQDPVATEKTRQSFELMLKAAATAAVLFAYRDS